MRTSDRGLSLIKSFAGLRLQAYQALTSGPSAMASPAA